MLTCIVLEGVEIAMFERRKKTGTEDDQWGDGRGCITNWNPNCIAHSASTTNGRAFEAYFAFFTFFVLILFCELTVVVLKQILYLGWNTDSHNCDL